MNIQDNITIEQLVQFFNSRDSLNKINKKLLNESTKTFRYIFRFMSNFNLEKP